MREREREREREGERGRDSKRELRKREGVRLMISSGDSIQYIRENIISARFI